MVRADAVVGLIVGRHEVVRRRDEAHGVADIEHGAGLLVLTEAERRLRLLEPDRRLHRHRRDRVARRHRHPLARRVRLRRPWGRDRDRVGRIRRDRANLPRARSVDDRYVPAGERPGRKAGVAVRNRRRRRAVDRSGRVSAEGQHRAGTAVAAIRRAGLVRTKHRHLDRRTGGTVNELDALGHVLRRPVGVVLEQVEVAAHKLLDVGVDHLHLCRRRRIRDAVRVADQHVRPADEDHAVALDRIAADLGVVHDRRHLDAGLREAADPRLAGGRTGRRDRPRVASHRRPGTPLARDRLFVGARLADRLESLAVVAHRISRKAPAHAFFESRDRLDHVDSLVGREPRQRSAEAGVARIRHRHRRQRIVDPIPIVPKLGARGSAVGIDQLVEVLGHADFVPAFETEVADLQDGERQR